MPQTYYHITKPKNIKTILQGGLKQLYGENSKAINDKREPRIYLCSKKSIDAWCIMLGEKTVIEVVLPDNFSGIELVGDSKISDEYICKTAIPVEYITRHFKKQPSKNILYELQKNYIYSLSYFCVLCARYYTPGTGWKDDPELKSEIEEAIKVYGECIIPVISRLNYQDMPREEKRRILRLIGDSGDYSFCDEYAVNYDPSKPVKRLYQMLIEYEQDEFANLRRQIYKLITINFKYCLRVNTGGWTG